MARSRAIAAVVALLVGTAGGACNDGDTAAPGPDPPVTTTRSTPAVPDSSRIAYMSNRADTNDFDIWVMDGDGSQPRVLGSSVDPEGAPAWSPDGSQLAFERSRLPENQILVMRGDGSDQRALTNGAKDANPTWSPDGARIAFDRTAPEGSRIFVMNADGSDPHALTTGPDADANPAWSPDGTRIAFQRRSGGSGATSIFVMNADGSDQHALTHGAQPDTDAAWSPDGSKVAFARGTPGGHSQIRVMQADGSGDIGITSPVGDSVDGAPTWAPDGARIAFYRQAKNETGEVWSMRADGSDRRNLTNKDSIDTLPSWTSAPPVPSGAT